jgi:endonuclease/exonuclease/phosphatase family metal-dependent hydrolase
MGGVKKAILLTNFLMIFLLGLTYLTPHITVDKWGWLSLLALAYPFIFLINFFFALGWIFFRSWLSMLSIAAIAIGLPYHARYFQLLPGNGKSTKCEESIRLLTYNLRGLEMVPAQKDAGYSARIDSVYNALADLKEFPDIICLQEVVKGELIGKRFNMDYTYHGPKSSLWLMSRYPIQKTGFIDGVEESPSAIWADIKTPQGMLRVYNMHLVSNRITNTAEELMHGTNKPVENTWNKIKFIIWRYRKTTQKRAGEAKAIRDHVANCKHPAIIAGDGNDPPLSHTYKVLRNGMKDSFVERGFGVSTTYNSTLPLLRIDYLLGVPGIYFKDHSTHHITYSDHYPVSAGICLRSESGS